MRFKWVYVLLMLLGLGSMAQTPSSPPVTVIVARQPIPRGTVLIGEHLYGADALVEAQTWDARFAPQTAFARLDDLEGLVARVDIPTRTPLLAGNLAPDLTLAAAIGSDTALLLPADLLGVPIERRRIAEAPPVLDPLDCVEAWGVFNFGGALRDTRFLLAESGVVIENVPGAAVVTLALPPQDALVVVWAQDNAIPLVLAAC